MKYRYYGLEEIMKNIISLIYTKLFFKNAKLIRRPIYIRQKNNMEYGEGFTTGYNCRIDMIGNDNQIKLKIGNNCIIGDNCQISAANSITIGDNLLVARNVYISDVSHGEYKESNNKSEPNIPPNERPLVSKSVNIGNNVWIGSNVSVLSGVSIGNGCIIGANSVVSKDIPDNCIAVGTPAKVIKKFNHESSTWIKV